MSLTFGTAGLTSSHRSPAAATRSSPPWTTRPSLPTSPSSSSCWTNAPGRAKVTGLAWSPRFRVHHRVADHYRAGRVLLAGDAAHVHRPPVVRDERRYPGRLRPGPGVRHRAARRLRGQAPPVAQRVVAFTDRMTRIATTRNAFARGARDFVLPLLGHTGLPKKLATELAELKLPVETPVSGHFARLAPAPESHDRLGVRKREASASGFSPVPSTP
ncbi:FAD-dependent monooxygenase [Streptomyces sp. M10(2022)]